MKPTGDDVAGLIARSSPAVRRRDAETLTALMQEITGREPQTWGTIIGFGSCHYRYPTGTEGDSDCSASHPARPRPRSTSSTASVPTPRHSPSSAPHTTGVGCLYIKDLEQVDLDVLRGILERSLAWVEAGGTPEVQLTVTG